MEQDDDVAHRRCGRLRKSRPLTAIKRWSLRNKKSILITALRDWSSRVLFQDTISELPVCLSFFFSFFRIQLISSAAAARLFIYYAAAIDRAAIGQQQQVP